MKAHKNPKQLRIAVPSSVSFPVLDSGTPLIALQRPPHLPFRRISLPSTPSPMIHRQSVVSMESFESLPEEGAGTSQIITVSSKPPSRRSPPSAFDSPTRSRPRRRLYNDRNDDKRQRIINEFYETERSYFGGLELIYSVSRTLLVPSAPTNLHCIAFSHPHHRVTRNPKPTPGSCTIDVNFRQLHRHLEPTPLVPLLPLRPPKDPGRAETLPITIINFALPFPIPLPL